MSKAKFVAIVVIRSKIYPTIRKTPVNSLYCLDPKPRNIPLFTMNCIGESIIYISAQNTTISALHKSRDLGMVSFYRA